MDFQIELIWGLSLQYILNPLQISCLQLILLYRGAGGGSRATSKTMHIPFARQWKLDIEAGIYESSKYEFLAWQPWNQTTMALRLDADKIPSTHRLQDNHGIWCIDIYMKD